MPIYVKDNNVWKEITDALPDFGNLYAHGYDSYGQLGDNNRNHVSAPIQIGTISNWLIISSGDHHVLTINNNGTLWACGRNNYGQLGLNIPTATSKSTFTQVGSDIDWSILFCGWYHTTLIKTSGTLWMCGSNSDGQLGQNNILHLSTPTQIGSDTNWLNCCSFGNSSYAIKTDGTLWACGENDYGQLGLDNRTYKSTFTQIGSDTDWKQINGGLIHICAIKFNGTLWSCGNNSYGQLGLNLPVISGHKSTFTQIGTDTDWAVIGCGYYHTFAIKTNGNLWSCGYNTNGQLGLNNIISKSTFTQIGTDTDWSKVIGGYYHSLFVKINGQFYSCGQNDYGQLGLNDIVNRSVPTQISTLNNTIEISCGSYHNVVINPPSEIEFI
jgi:alpha-tubulin suppressor-like RCC1 family protein